MLVDGKAAYLAEKLAAYWVYKTAESMDTQTAAC